MSFAFFAAALCMTITAVALILAPLLRQRFKAESRLGKWRLELQSLNDAHAGGQSRSDALRIAANRPG